MPAEIDSLTGRVGGPLGRHVRAGGRWFDATRWAIGASIAVWVVLMLRQLPCRQTEVGAPVNAFLRTCYTDLTVLYQGREIGLGGLLYVDIPLEYPVLTGGQIAVTRWLTGLLGGVVGPEATGQQQLEAANIFFVINAVVLFVFFLATIVAHLKMGEEPRSRRWALPAARPPAVSPTRSWDALLIAGSPLVMLSGLINWDMLAVALTAWGMLTWARGRPAVAGGVIGLAFAAKFYPAILLPVYLLLCLRAGKLRDFGKFLGAGVGAWLAVNLPLMIWSWSGWSYFYTFNADRGADLGSLWYVFSLMGLAVPNVSAVGFLAMAAGGIGISWLVLNAPRRPRVGQIALLVLVTFLVFNKVYSPQYMLWLLPFVVLARPVLRDVAIFTASEAVYFFAIWGFLEGVLGIGTGADALYWLSVFLRVGVQVWIALRVVNDVLHPWDDPVRQPFVDDPIGGVLNHAPDAAWMLRSAPPTIEQEPAAAPAVEHTGAAGAGQKNSADQPASSQ